MKKLLLLVIVLGAGVAAYLVYRPVKPAGAATVTRVAVSRGTVTETVRAMGYLEPLRRVNVGSQVSGTVKGLYADFNDVVKKGQLLAEIDSSLLEVQVSIQQANIDRQRGDIASQEAQLEDQKRQFDRVRQLRDRGLQTDQQFEAADLAIKTRDAQIASSRKQLVQAEANLAAAKLNLSYAKIVSPIDGVVIQRRVNDGQTVQASMNTPTFFMLCTPLEVLKLTAWVDEADIGRVRPGMEVGFQVSTYGSEMFKGTVDAIRLNAATFNNVVTYPVWISVPNDDLRLRPSMTAQVFVYVSKTAEVVRIPNDALKFRPTRAAYMALGAPPPTDEPVRAIDQVGDRVVDPTALRPVTTDGEATTIDELFAPLPKADSRATVWTWNEAKKQFSSISVRVGVSDGVVSELLSGDVRVGDQLVTAVMLPMAPMVRPGQNPLMGNRGRGRQ